MNKENLIFDSLNNKAAYKQAVFSNTKNQFALLKKESHKLVEKHQGKLKKEVRLEIREVDENNFLLILGGDVLLFHMHTNVFKFEENSTIWQSSYLEDDPNKGFTGIIYVYNFLYDTFLYHRESDLGNLTARIFINLEDHFMVEGKGKLATHYKQFFNDKLNNASRNELLLNLMESAINFDLVYPNYQHVQQLPYAIARQFSNNLSISTSKKMGFKLKEDSNKN